ncbi:hypothetical protein GJ629_00625 [Halapricum sp. CBA1109]|uniref:hypothetical protein n=1 Tax=Halapricum sp. CBA1109 TaxID=2668068 RepID=UPI0012FBF549|nr:hypothetical protein [Halapricum sp. CBA1109]MUV88573.1 hypothetical protein [Halapricum sp. CBA1109]
MKQGSTDDPFAEDPFADGTDGDEADDAAQTADAELPDAERDDGGDDDGRRSLPYIHARDGVKDGRTQRPVFLRDDVEAGIDDLLAEMESELGEDVYKTDVTEAAMVVAQEHPELVRETLEEWGYGW